VYHVEVRTAGFPIVQAVEDCIVRVAYRILIEVEANKWASAAGAARHSATQVSAQLFLFGWLQDSVRTLRALALITVAEGSAGFIAASPCTSPQKPT
jgi:hypothetical protein